SPATARRVRALTATGCSPQLEYNRRPPSVNYSTSIAADALESAAYGRMFGGTSRYRAAPQGISRIQLVRGAFASRRPQPRRAFGVTINRISACRLWVFGRPKRG